MHLGTILLRIKGRLLVLVGSTMDVVGRNSNRILHEASGRPRHRGRVIDTLYILRQITTTFDLLPSPRASSASADPEPTLVAA